ncbi:hypothetical protein [Mangrovihabitans endophyticus]|uniref:Uncharacterized protein n=1 Tax=Mangrovihabitans endophyticus TaxID=1751298 RepID=A0A8J3FPQ1_9ACTN|nr:hypothetical protein [Mangrovihabitans endophyticus]GGL03173.1 hypothetical protein GCM10012284_42260 [Mangrovihabitans endophyticus]
MPETEPDQGHSARLLRGLLWAGVGLAPIGAVVVLVGGSESAMRFAVLLVAVCVVLIGAAMLIRHDPVLLSIDVEDRVAERVEELRDELREDLAAELRSSGVQAAGPAGRPAVDAAAGRAIVDLGGQGGGRAVVRPPVEQGQSTGGRATVRSLGAGPHAADRGVTGSASVPPAPQQRGIASVGGPGRAAASAAPPPASAPPPPAASRASAAVRPGNLTPVFSDHRGSSAGQAAADRFDDGYGDARYAGVDDSAPGRSYGSRYGTPAGAQDGYEPVGAQDGYEPVGAQDGYEPAGAQDGYEPANSQDGYEPSESWYAEPEEAAERDYPGAAHLGAAERLPAYAGTSAHPRGRRSAAEDFGYGEARYGGDAGYGGDARYGGESSYGGESRHGAAEYTGRRHRRAADEEPDSYGGYGDYWTADAHRRPY